MAQRRIALIDDHSLFTAAFSTLMGQLRSDYRVEAHDDPVAFLKTAGDLAGYDLFILDLVMQKMNGLSLLATLKQRAPRCRVLMLSGVGTEPPVADMRRLGAQGFVHKSEDADILLAAIDRILDGELCFPSLEGEAAALEDDFSASGPDDRAFPNLAPRQLEVLNLIAGGETNKAIAARMNISENTVKSHLKAIFEALGEHTRTGCVRTARTLGLIG
ncbi:response regulator transcription factor [Maricaulis parjimensis]|uniref:response regulator transcription factor n=1 Tax=Maricaulis parjimensis TaxID=144023 RepID=UPI00193AC1D8|nr:response regulator transcription factor [Maricaulis parjimensis]